MKPALPNIDAGVHYFNPRLQARLDAIRERPMTVVEAPMGYGKTMAVREYLRAAGMKAVWTTALHAGPDIFWRDFCENLGRALPGETETVSALERLGYPRDAVRTGEAYRLLAGLDYGDEQALVVDDFHLLPAPADSAPAGMGGLCESLAKRGWTGPRLILISRNAYAGDRDMLRLKNLLTVVGRDDLALDENDIREYYRRCGLRLDASETRGLFRRTSGWISALYLHLLRYGRHGTDAGPDALNRLVEKEVLSPLSGETLDLLLATHPLERFTRAQAEFVHRKGPVGPLLDELLRVNSFLAHADGVYTLHAVVRECLGRRFDALPGDRRRTIAAACGECVLADGDVMGALRLFHAAEEYERALAALESGAGRRLLTKDMALLGDIFAACPPALLERHISAEFLYALHAFTNGDAALFGERLGRLSERCAALPEGDPETDRRRSDLEFLLSLAAYNDIAAMSRHHRRANELLRGGSTGLFLHQSPWTLGSPSVLFMFHRESGGLDREVGLMHECMPHYYRLASGHGSGAEHQMEAEALFQRGDFAGAAASGRRAEAFAAARDQFGVALAALFVRQRLALRNGDYPAARALLDDMRERIRARKEYFYLHTVDLCEGHLLAALGRTEGAAPWLRRGADSGGRLYAFAGGYYHIVHGGILLAEERWAEAIGLFSWLLESERFANNLLLTIHARIYLAAAHQALEKTAEAAQELRRAGDLAFPDGIVMPFVEFWRHIAGVKPADDGKAASAAPDRVRALAGDWEKSRRHILARDLPPPRPLLTRKERELARMAAAGMKYREIADAVHLAHSTVKRSFATIYAKLGISNRDELREFLARRNMEES